MARVVRLVLAMLISAVALTGVVRLVAPADGDSGVRRQLAFLKHELESGAAEEAQTQFPEGFFFMYALYGLTAADLNEIDEARWALEKLESEAGRAPFGGDMSLPYGVFYRGWTNWLRGGILMRQPSAQRDAAELRRFEDDSAAIAAAFDASPTPFLVSYPGRAWPVDSTVAMASLRLHDKLLTPAYDTTVIRWVANVRARLDPATGLMPHTADADTGEPTSGAQGTSQSIMQRFLPEIDPEFARQQYGLFRTEFLSAPLGIGPTVREHPNGTDGPSNVDSGPLVLGVSLSATVVTIGAAKLQGDDSLADGLANFGEVAGLPISTPWTKRYAFGAAPIGDAFLAWSKSARPWVFEPPSPSKREISHFWRLPLLVFFLALGTAPWLVEAARRRRSSML
ncbi:hypothetical protein [Paractinoplanes atraurantiacus]|uniref:Uncharacterized protein n=1 Tax=Paractinoplanes atraurantiacus TaxID=1036182 RepID=A0A285J9D4_9ACTN|nr:hypothetical protein [Actinoplanes atraurantiacus]SNY56930.1 hypothetical protein SAMN05421748_11828 [Actinoplanes atraurantiacus]